MPVLWIECRLGFCRARMGHLSDHHSVSSSQGRVYTLGESEDQKLADDEEDDIDKPKSGERAIIEEEGEEKEQETKIIRGKKLVRQATRGEYEEHMRTHTPFRQLCSHRVKGTRTNDARKAEEEKEKQEIPLVSWGYMEQRGKDGNVLEEEEGRNKTRIAID